MEGRPWRVMKERRKQCVAGELLRLSCRKEAARGYALNVERNGDRNTCKLKHYQLLLVEGQEEE